MENNQKKGFREVENPELKPQSKLSLAVPVIFGLGSMFLAYRMGLTTGRKQGYSLGLQFGKFEGSLVTQNELLEKFASVIADIPKAGA